MRTIFIQQKITGKVGLYTNNALKVKPGFHYTTNAMTMTQKQSDYKVDQSSLTLIALICFESKLVAVVVVTVSVEARLYNFKSLGQ